MEPQTQIRIGMHVRILSNRHGRCWETGYVKSIQNNEALISSRYGGTIEFLEDLEITGETEQ